MHERRNKLRFPFQQPVVLRLREEEKWREIHGIVENASETGILLITESEIRQGAEVEVTIAMPHNVRMSAPGTVNRVDRRPHGQIAVAVKCHRPFSETRGKT